MAELLEPHDFNGLYKDQLVRRVYVEERAERWGLFDEFRLRMDDYHERMDGLVHDYHHDLEPGGRHVVATMTRNPRGSQVGQFDYIAVFKKSQTDGVREASLTTFSIARHHYALSWNRQELRKFVTKEPVGFERTMSEHGPSSTRTPATMRNPRAAEVRRFQEFASTPELDWHPKLMPVLAEHLRVKEVLGQAIGIVACLDKENAFPWTESLEGRFVGAHF